MFRYIYKITCTKGSYKDKFYFGQHTTNNLDDGYKGSGRLINDYYQKYPDDYIKEILCFCDTEEELNQLEYNVIHPYLHTKMCLNICEGGYYGKPSYETRLRLSETAKTRTGEKNGMYGKKHKEKSKKKMAEKKKGSHPWNVGFTGKHHTETSKQKISESCKNKGMYGKHHTETSKQKLSEAHKGKSPGNKGKHMVWNDENDHTKGFHYE